MELFHEYHNRFFNALVELAERIADGEIISAAEFDDIYFEIGSRGRKRLGQTFLDQVKYNTKLPLFDFSDRNRVKLAFDVDPLVTISDIPLKVERVWLEAAICDNYARLFWDLSSAENIRSTFAKDEFPYYNMLDNRACDMELSELCMLQPIFQCSLSAITQSHKVRFNYDNTQIEGLPLRIVYDEKNKHFQLLVKHGAEIKMYEFLKISNFSDLQTIQSYYVSVKEMMSKYKAEKPIVFEVTDYKKRRSIERAVIEFSVYDHIVRMVDDNKVEITINYYTFDLDDAVRRILSFGTDAIISSPDIAIEHMKKILRSI